MKTSFQEILFMLDLLCLLYLLSFLLSICNGTNIKQFFQYFFIVKLLTMDYKFVIMLRIIHDCSLTCTVICLFIDIYLKLSLKKIETDKPN